MIQGYLLKTITLVSFATLLSGFIVYRSGKLKLPATATHYFTGSEGGAPVAALYADTPAATTTTPNIMSSSKSMYIPKEGPYMIMRTETIAGEPVHKFYIDTSEAAKKRLQIMSSSKSGPVFTPVFKDTFHLLTKPKP